jgi:zinc transporter 5/7
VEILTGFLNCAALFFAAGTIVFEAIERLFEPQDIKGEKLFLISVLGLLVNIVGIFAFDHGGMHHHHHHHDHAHHDCGHGNHHHHHETGNLLLHGSF